MSSSLQCAVAAPAAAAELPPATELRPRMESALAALRARLQTDKVALQEAQQKVGVCVWVWWGLGFWEAHQKVCCAWLGL